MASRSTVLATARVFLILYAENTRNSPILGRFHQVQICAVQQVAAFHAEWVTNLCRGLAAAVLVMGPVGSPLGFVSCSLAEGAGRIPLIAVRGEARGQGIGSRLIVAAQQWFRSQGVATAWVKTQAQNYAALGLYGRHGFLPGRTELVFSVAIPEWMPEGDSR